jgi:hypothetical protein
MLPSIPTPDETGLDLATVGDLEGNRESQDAPCGMPMTRWCPGGTSPILTLNGFSKMNMNFFEWLRDGVRQSVILGVSDAVEQIGVPETEQEVQPALAALLGNDAAMSAKPRRKTSSASTGTSRKRLGKSLKDMNTTK